MTIIDSCSSISTFLKTVGLKLKKVCALRLVQVLVFSILFLGLALYNLSQTEYLDHNDIHINFTIGVHINYKDRYDSMLQTWLKGEEDNDDDIVFFSCQRDVYNYVTEKSENVTFYNMSCDYPHWLRTMYMLRMEKQDTSKNISYFLKLDDDSFPFLNTIRREMKSANPFHSKLWFSFFRGQLQYSNPFMIGTFVEEPLSGSFSPDTLSELPKYLSHNVASDTSTYPLGGAGYILSKEALSLFVSRFWEYCALPLGLVYSPTFFKKTAASEFHETCVPPPEKSDDLFWNMPETEECKPYFTIPSNNLKWIPGFNKTGERKLLTVVKTFNEDWFIGLCGRILNVTAIHEPKMHQHVPKNWNDIMTAHYVSSSVASKLWDFYHNHQPLK